MGHAVVYELIPPRVVARVFAHTLETRDGQVPCWTWVTQGLRSFGQREIAFSLERVSACDVTQSPSEPLWFLRAVARFAERGEFVDLGGITEFGESGLFGRPAIRGVVYCSAVPTEGVVHPPDCLQAVPLVGPELNAVKSFGALRVLARLGHARAFYPTATWCTPDRESIVERESSTILENTASLVVSGASAVVEGERISLRLPREAQALFARVLPELPLETALAILTTLDPSADACMVWHAGQASPEAISPPASRGARVSACFALFAPQQSGFVANLIEDGTAFLLTNTQWERIRAALTTGTPIEMNEAGSKSFALEWYVRPTVTPVETPPAVGDMRMHLRESLTESQSRISTAALMQCAESIERVVQEQFAQATVRARLEVRVTLRPGLPGEIHAESWPTLAGLPDLRERLAELVLPAVQGGEVAFSGVFSLAGGVEHSAS